MIEIRYKDIDPDTGYIINDALTAECNTIELAEFILSPIKEYEGAEFFPNRHYYLSGTPSELGTYEERVGWFLQNYYETGMEYENMLENLKNTNLDALETVSGIIAIPKLCKDLAPKNELDI